MSHLHNVTAADFHGEPARSLSNPHLRLDYLEASPRIVRLVPDGGPNLFADLGRQGRATPYGEFRPRGGHRLWHAPEDFPLTYLPDNDGSELTALADGVRIQQPPEPETHVVKSLEIHLDPDRPLVTLRHELRNAGAAPILLAPWALTMLRPGGVAILPQPQGNVDPSGLLPNRRLVLWPYTRIRDPRIDLGDEFILVRASSAETPLKLGCFTPHGWLGYYLDGFLFVKRFAATPSEAYPDNGCNAELYCIREFIELESLAPLVSLPPGASVLHTETWEVYQGLSMPGLSEAVRQALQTNLPTN